jgi:hypothetical protein
MGCSMMTDKWRTLLPHAYANQIIEPLFFESHMDPWNNLIKYIGFDKHARRCFFFSQSVKTEDCRDNDGFPVLENIIFERTISWRLKCGEWIEITHQSEKHDQSHMAIKSFSVELKSGLTL